MGFMDIKEIGRMVYTLRTEQGMSQEELVRGICSIPTLSRLESGERRPDILVFNAILERLGKATDVISVALTLEEFEYFVERRNIEIFLQEKKFEQAEKELVMLEAEEKENLLRLQDIDWLYGMLYILWDKKEKAEQYIHKAILVSIPDFDKTFMKLRLKKELLQLWLNETETSLILSYAYLLEELGKEGEALLQNMRNYINLKLTEGKTQNRRIAQTMYLLAWIKKKQGKLEECYRYCEEVIAAEVKNGAIQLLAQALLMEAACIEAGVSAENQKLRYKQYQIIYRVFEENGEKIETKIPILYIKVNSQGKYLVDELLHYARQRAEVSEEKLSEGICTPETLSRLETGKRNPTIKNFYALMEKLEINIGYYNTEFVAEQFETLEEAQKMKALIRQGKYEEAEKKLHDIQEEIDMDLKGNQQYFGLRQAVIDWRLKRISTENLLKELQRLINLTINIEAEGYSIYYQPMPIEISLINQLAVVYRNMGRKKEAVELLMPLYEYFHRSKMKAYERGKQYFMIIGNLASELEESGNLEKAMEVIDESVKAAIKSDYVVYLGRNLGSKGYFQDQRKKKICLDTFEQAYYLCDLYEDFQNRDIVKEYVYKNYKVEYII